MRDFDGVGDRVDFGSPATLDDIVPMSISCIMRSDPTDTSLYAIVNKAATEEGWRFSIYGTNELGFFHYFSGADGYWEATATTATALLQVGVTYDGSSASNDAKLYADGVSLTVSKPLGSPTGTRQSDAAQSLIVGGGVDVDFDGVIAEVGVWNAILTADEMASLGKRFSPLLVRPQDLVLYAPLLGNNSPEPDLINGAAGTVTGTTKVSHTRIYMPRRVRAGAS
jgi:hypothetical protein